MEADPPSRKEMPLKEISTKDRIKQASRKLFYEKGYHSTSFVDIATLSDTSQGAIYYNFESKPAIGYSIFRDYFSDISETARRLTLEHTGSEDPVVSGILSGMIQYRMLRDDPKAYRFYREFHNMRYSADNYPVPSDEAVMNIAGELGISPDKENDEALMLTIANRDTVSRLYITYLDGQMHTSEEFFLDFVTLFLYRLIGVDEELLSEKKALASEILERSNVIIDEYFVVRTE